MKKKNLLFAVVFLASALSLNAQQAQGTLDLKTNYFYNMETFYLLDFDFNNGRNSPDFFSYSLSYQPNDPVNGAPIKICIEFEMSADVPSLNLTNRRVFYIKTQPFDFKGEVTISSQDLDMNMKNIYYTDGRPLTGIRIDDSDFLPESDMKRIQTMIYTFGKLPSGNYMFDFSILNENGEMLKNQSQTVSIANPATLDLVSPGGALEDNFEISTLYPVFQWESIDFMWSPANCSECGYYIRVTEYNQSRHSSIEEAMNDRANLPYPDNGRFFKLPSIFVPNAGAADLYTADNTFQFPLTGAKSLESGKTYVWQVQKSYPTTSGPETVESPIFVFKTTATGASGGISNAAQYLQLLEQLVDPSLLQSLLTGELNGYSPTGVVTLNNSQQLTFDQLSALVTQALTGKITIKPPITIE
ncbi:MAG: hypothetical protein COT43_11695 [Candidatus Marinimicrobia bacterium CG08_land_8_20_14_0_20_45_22]|nr:MAG: hypothetical protein COT43_11695 [Candidatus Marinimicrobia bacterium CG08_land_8_20_14_0_20_45_22]